MVIGKKGNDYEKNLIVMLMTLMEETKLSHQQQERWENLAIATPKIIIIIIIPIICMVIIITSGALSLHSTPIPSSFSHYFVLSGQLVAIIIIFTFFHAVKSIR